jgi:hypothetical protein
MIGFLGVINDYDEVTFLLLQDMFAVDLSTRLIFGRHSISEERLTTIQRHPNCHYIGPTRHLSNPRSMHKPQLAFRFPFELNLQISDILLALLVFHAALDFRTRFHRHPGILASVDEHDSGPPMRFLSSRTSRKCHTILVTRGPRLSPGILWKHSLPRSQEECVKPDNPAVQSVQVSRDLHRERFDE